MKKNDNKTKINRQKHASKAINARWGRNQKNDDQSKDMEYE